MTRFGPFDILFEPSGAPPYEDLGSHALRLRRFDRDIAVASIDDLIAMKRATGREKDATHLTILLEFVQTEGRPA